MIVVDASVAAKWVLPEEHSERALALVADAAGIQTLTAPPLLPFEIANIFRRQMVREGLPLVDADRLMVGFLAFPVTLTMPADLSRRALVIAEAHRMPAAYDAHNVALAEFLGCELWTDDRRLLRQVGGTFAFVRWIGDYAAGSGGGEVA